MAPVPGFLGEKMQGGVERRGKAEATGAGQAMAKEPVEIHIMSQVGLSKDVVPMWTWLAIVAKDQHLLPLRAVLDMLSCSSPAAELRATAQNAVNIRACVELLHLIDVN